MLCQSVSSELTIEINIGGYSTGCGEKKCLSDRRARIKVHLPNHGIKKQILFFFAVFVAAFVGGSACVLG